MIKFHLGEWIKEILGVIRVSLFHSKCQICQQLLVYREEEIVCRSCLHNVYLFTGPVCEKCGKNISDGSLLCGECLLNPPSYQKHLSYSLYEGILKELIILFKYYEIKKLKNVLAGYYMELFRSKVKGNFDGIIPVPADRNRKRDFDPNLEISKILSRKLNIRLFQNQLIKVKQTAPQVSLPFKKRIKNLDGAFKLKNPSFPYKQKVLLVDDVYTTGTTIKKCTQILKRTKNQVVAITLARSK